jgi:hypothetical protein
VPSCWHVTTIRKMQRYEQSGCIKAPVHAWLTAPQAIRFGLQTGRRVIVRLTMDDRWKPLEGHQGAAAVLDEDLPWPGCLT